MSETIAQTTSTTETRLPAWKLWLLAARPKTLPAAVAPVVVGSAIAIHEGRFHALAALMALLTALLLQIAANFANDALDFKRGADPVERMGPTRVTSAGLLSHRAVLVATGIALALAALTGLYLVARGGWPLLLLGIAAIVCAVAYTGGPFPLGYLGLGEVFVFLFFGLAAVTGTAYAQTLELTPLSLAASVPVGALAVAILVVNNLRDLPTDAATGKRTVAVRIGPERTRAEYRVMLVIALASPVAFWLAGWLTWWWLLTLGSWPLAWWLWHEIERQRSRALNLTLAATARMQLVYSVLLAAALVLS
ncbi:MAG TPA: 1,4-dihydroxy-2-naphthoate polyprenyltransferase [Thermomicrobiales bacterium]|nr:1,4-dihydroxy-2-naphthoate polyprenyltransferase [Thermomicrobiales bacterium]